MRGSELSHRVIKRTTNGQSLTLKTLAKEPNGLTKQGFSTTHQNVVACWQATEEQAVTCPPLTWLGVFEGSLRKLVCGLSHGVDAAWLPTVPSHHHVIRALLPPCFAHLIPTSWSIGCPTHFYPNSLEGTTQAVLLEASQEVPGERIFPFSLNSMTTECTNFLWSDLIRYPELGDLK